MSDRFSFILYTAYREKFEMLNEKEQANLIMSIFHYVDGEKPEFISKTVEMAFSFIKTNIDYAKIQYDKKCAVNKANGAKGGRPKETDKPTETQDNPTVISETQDNPTEPNKTLYDIDIDIDIENDIENENDIVIDFEKEIDNVKPIITPKPKKQPTPDFTPPTLEEFQNYGYAYAKKRFDFPISKVKTFALLESSYVHWTNENWKRGRTPMKSWEQTVEGKVRKENTKLKDWEAEKIDKNTNVHIDWNQEC